MSVTAARKSSLKRLYGITPEQYDELFEKQGGCCAVCRRPQREFKTRLAVDHDHVSLAIRGLLCTFCNSRVIGRHRDPELFRRAWEYLAKEHCGWFAPPKGRKKRKKKHIAKYV